MILATQKQITYLQALADRAEHIKSRHPSLIPAGLDHTRYKLGITSEKADLRIRMYRSILDNADLQLHPRRKEELEDLPA